MIVVSPQFIGNLVTCSACGALLSWEPKDVYSNTIYCPICKQPSHVDFDKNYDGVVKEEKVENVPNNPT